VLVPVALASGIGHIDWGTELVVSLAYLVIVNSIVSISLFVGLLQRGDATRISALMYLVPPLALLIAWVVLGEKMTSLALLGMLICITGVWLVNRAGRATPA
jgi:drug/metabolite transporter (DMT)-like permease